MRQKIEKVSRLNQAYATPAVSIWALAFILSPSTNNWPDTRRNRDLAVRISNHGANYKLDMFRLLN